MVLDVVKALGRRWYVVVLGLFLSLGLAAGAYNLTPPEYNARALVLLLPGANAVGVGGNPFLALSGLEQPASIVVAYFSSESARAEIERRSPTAEYEVVLDESTRGPVIAVDVTDQSPGAALSTLDFLLTRIPEELARLQGEVDAPAPSVITSMPIAVDDEATRDSSDTIRNVIAAGVVGIVFTGFVAFAIDGLLLRRRMRRNSSEPAPSDVDIPNESAEPPPPKGHRRRRRPKATEAPEAADEQIEEPEGSVTAAVEVRAGRNS